MGKPHNGRFKIEPALINSKKTNSYRLFWNWVEKVEGLFGSCQVISAYMEYPNK
jgi:hypothetical protein